MSLSYRGVSIKGGVPSKPNQKDVNKKYYYYIIFGITFFLFSIVQDNIRPNYDGGNSLIIYFLGVIPNFLPGIGLPSLFYVVIPDCLLYTSPSPRDLSTSRMPSSA